MQDGSSSKNETLRQEFDPIAITLDGKGHEPDLFTSRDRIGNNLDRLRNDPSATEQIDPPDNEGNYENYVTVKWGSIQVRHLEWFIVDGLRITWTITVA